ncbi:hypothetical protein EBO15_40310 [Actinomadura harenae]|uniref:Uncharacterized protein n=1 Tax=Actinomadura harenae TaxID=2483351 RepID=A0A3M2LAZ9_9ACTN|nr:hypothetical protein EBO15_40310 [Actinomadura harenae]
MEHELVGLHGFGGRFRPVAPGPFVLTAVAAALAPVRPGWLWAALVLAAAAGPWLAGAVAAVLPWTARHRGPSYWRLSERGLERIGPDGGGLARYERDRIEGLGVTTADGVLVVQHKFGTAAIGPLPQLGLEPLTLFVTARRLGIPVRLVHGEVSDLLDPALDEPGHPPGADPGDDEAELVIPLGPTRDLAAERRLLDQEAALLAAAHEDAVEPASPASGPAVLASAEPVPSRRRVQLLGALSGALGVVMVLRLAVDGPDGFGVRVAAACWVLASLTAVHASRRRSLVSSRTVWTIDRDTIEVSRRTRRGRPQQAATALAEAHPQARPQAPAEPTPEEPTPEEPTPEERGVVPARGALSVAATEIAALVVGPGLRADALTGRPRRSDLSVLAFDHRLRLVARLPAHGIDAFQLAHALADRGYRVITPGARAPRSPEYGLEGLPEIFARVPGGRLVVEDGGLGWADAAGEVVLRMPEDRLGGIELLTIAGHAWVRLYDSDGDEFFAAPLSALRISRTDLREAARREGLPVNDAEYDAYLNAAFHSAVSTLTLSADPDTDTDTDPNAGPDAAPALTSGLEPGVVQGELAAPPEPSPADAPGVLLDATRRSRVGTYGMSLLLAEIVAIVGAAWLGPDLGGFVAAASWSVPAGLLVGLGGYWLHDRDRPRLRVSPAGLAVVTRRGRVRWELARDRVAGVGIDDAAERMPRLVVWSPTGRVLRQVTFPPDLAELRRACERYGLPWGPPDADRPTPPPPEL